VVEWALLLRAGGWRLSLLAGPARPERDLTPSPWSSLLILLLLLLSGSRPRARLIGITFTVLAGDGSVARRAPLHIVDDSPFWRTRTRSAHVMSQCASVMVLHRNALN
jgi:hypothetical protein